MIYEGDKDIFSPFIGEILDGNIYALLAYYNVLCKISASSGSMTVVKEFEDEQGDVLYVVGKDIKGELILVPHTGRKVKIFDEKQVLKREIGLENVQRVNYNRLHTYGNKCFFLPIFRNDIAELDIETENFEYHKIPVEKLGLKSETEFSVVSSYAVGERVFLMCSSPNMLIEFNCKSREFTLWPDKQNWMSMCYSGGYYWVGQSDNSIIRFFGENFKDGELVKLPDGYRASEILPMSGCRCVAGKVLFYSYNANMILRIDEKTAVCDRLNLPDEDFKCKDDKLRNGPAIIGVGENIIVFYSKRSGELIVSNVLSNTYERIKLKPDESIKRIVASKEVADSSLLSLLKTL